MKPKTLWVTRDSEFESYEIYSEKPIWFGRYSGFFEGHRIIKLKNYEGSEFEKLTGIKLKGGKDSIVKIKIVRVK